MTVKFWVSYVITRSGPATGQHADGTGVIGSIDVTLPGPPADAAAIAELANMLASALQDRGQIDRSQHVMVLSWSEMGD